VVRQGPFNVASGVSCCADLELHLYLPGPSLL
ncbi:rhomboid protease ROM2, partial [Toxoplasma gondii RUB]